MIGKQKISTLALEVLKLSCQVSLDFYNGVKAKQSKAKQSKAKQSKAKQSKAKQSKAKQSKAKQSFIYRSYCPILGQTKA
jgi:hypothetical protein